MLQQSILQQLQATDKRLPVPPLNHGVLDLISAFTVSFFPPGCHSSSIFASDPMVEGTHLCWLFHFLMNFKVLGINENLSNRCMSNFIQFEVKLNYYLEKIVLYYNFNVFFLCYRINCRGSSYECWRNTRICITTRLEDPLARWP